VVESGVCVDPVVVVVELPGVVDSVESDVQAAAPKINSASANTTPPASVNLFPILVNGTVPPFLVDSRSRYLGLPANLRAPIELSLTFDRCHPRGCSQEHQTMLLLARETLCLPGVLRPPGVPEESPARYDWV